MILLHRHPCLRSLLFVLLSSFSPSTILFSSLSSFYPFPCVQSSICPVRIMLLIGLLDRDGLSCEGFSLSTALKCCCLCCCCCWLGRLSEACANAACSCCNGCCLFWLLGWAPPRLAGPVSFLSKGWPADRPVVENLRNSPLAPDGPDDDKSGPVPGAAAVLGGELELPPK